MYLGSAWYPEHWPESRWATDLRLMREANMNVARIAEYAWSRMEPREGAFDLDWLARAVDLAAQHGIQIVLGTPSDAPPAWLTQKYPEVLRVEADGQRTVHGGRRHFNPTSAKYRGLSTRIASMMADRFGRHPNVIGWQIGNEFCRYSHDDETRAAFQAWLRDRYGSLEALNQKWSTSYWSQEYSDWSQIHIPAGWQNPCLDLAFFRFMTKSFRGFQKLQIDAIRARSDPRQWITHNMHGFEDIDFNDITEDCDIASWDPYPGTREIDFARFGWISDFCRPMKPRPFWVMETQPGRVNWKAPSVDLQRGALRGLCWHYLAHGAEAILFWQWRAAPGGQEQYHGTVLAADGNPRPLFQEIKQLGDEMRRLAPLLTGARPQAEVAVTYSYVNQFTIRKQKHHPDFDGQAHMTAYYAPVRVAGIDVDVIDPRRPLESYKLVIAPHLHCVTDAQLDSLVRFVEAGGHLVLGARSGFKNEENALLESRQPGTRLAKLLGAHVADYFTLERPIEVSGELGTGQTKIWAEPLIVEATDAEVLLRFGTYNGWIDDQPAVVSRAVGAGRITYVGTWLEPTMMETLVAWAVEHAAVTQRFSSLPEGVEVCRLVKDGKDLYIAINHGSVPQTLSLPCTLRDVLKDKNAAVKIELAAYDVAVLADEDMG